MRSDNEGKAVLGRGRGGDEGAVFSAVLEATVRRIVEHGKEVVIIGPVPEQQFDVQLLWRAMWLGDNRYLASQPSARFCCGKTTSFRCWSGLLGFQMSEWCTRICTCVVRIPAITKRTVSRFI